MLINGKYETYKVKWESQGWSYAVPIVFAKRKMFFLPIYRWKRVWEGRAKSDIYAEKMLPLDMEQWFKSAVFEFEKYKEQWQEFYKTR